MTEVILVRHGETDWNVREIFRGRIDVALNETGIRQAALLSQYLSGLKLDAIYSSSLRRALKTAETIASHQRLDVKIADGLIDLDYGEWQGLSHKKVREEYKGLYAEWIKNPHRVKMPGGESLDEVTNRAAGAVNEANTRHQGTVVLVSHRAVNKVLICALLGLDNSHFWNIRQDTGGMTTFIHENERFTLTEHNNTSYLKPLQQAPHRDF